MAEKPFSSPDPAASHPSSATDAYSNNNGGTPLLDQSMTSDAALKRIQRSGSIAITPELFEKIYLAPQNAVKGDLRKTFGNPTPLALLGLVMALTPFSCDIMGWRGAGGDGAAATGSYYFMGGLLMIIGGVLEWVLGNTFPFLVFCAYGGFWLSFASTLTPSIGAYGHYSTSYSEMDPSAGLSDSPEFATSFGFFLISMAFLSLMFAICCLRINVCLAVLEWALMFVFSLLTATFWQTANGAAAVAGKCLIAAGAFGFVAAAAGWWLLFALTFASVDFPLQLPVGDLSHIIKGAAQMAELKTKSAEHQV
ncbi:MAG: hypothetical protein ASARMPREDX12_005976 [Alectoria sarmentosa]|nr:MAG: hypothetical protein ASARMPRED_002989 [Alectoria sarmentosa]CAD6592314.1 MAG: hypothetical protein ASARMPREDX12_005976 [Alectoria sarmentosa]